VFEIRSKTPSCETRTLDHLRKRPPAGIFLIWAMISSQPGRISILSGTSLLYATLGELSRSARRCSGAVIGRDFSYALLKSVAGMGVGRAALLTIAAGSLIVPQQSSSRTRL
jgi:hypothetical protein